jgi:hypothetical protein
MSRSLADLRRDIEDAPAEGGKTIIRTISEAQPDLRVKNTLAGHALGVQVL